MARVTRQLAYKSDKHNDIVIAESKLRRLKRDLREHIRYISDEYPILSDDWLRMSDSLFQLATVARMELQLAPSRKQVKVTKQAGKKSDGTLWDQERTEHAIQILIEEGKLNLLLRLLHQFCELRRDHEAFDRCVADCKVSTRSSDELIRARCNTFESGIGEMLMFALRHVECMQIVDVPELIAHCSEVLHTHIRKGGPLGNAQEHKLQDVIVPFYIESIVRSMEHMDEERIMDVMEEKHVVPMLVQYLAMRSMSLQTPLLISGVMALSIIMQSDPFSVEPERWISKSTHDSLMVVDRTVVQELLNATKLTKKDIRPWLDFTKKLKRRIGTAAAAANTKR